VTAVRDYYEQGPFPDPWYRAPERPRHRRAAGSAMNCRRFMEQEFQGAVGVAQGSIV
jgi:hypothetical protein